MLSTESLKRIDREIAKYPIDKKQSAVMSALAIAQEEKGWLASETMDFVATTSSRWVNTKLQFVQICLVLYQVVMKVQLT